MSTVLRDAELEIKVFGEVKRNKKYSCKANHLERKFLQAINAKKSN